MVAVGVPVLSICLRYAPSDAEAADDPNILAALLGVACADAGY